MNIAPENVLLLYHRANVYHQSHESKKAIVDLELALKTVVQEDIRQSILQLRKKCLIEFNHN